NQQPLAGATIVVNEGLASAASDQNGFFAITIQGTDSIWLEVSFLGYADSKLNLVLDQISKKLLISLVPKSNMLSEVVIEDDYFKRTKREEAQNIEVAGREFINRWFEPEPEC
ncbi:MAG TPA: carboxypeptidase-like regulatory domain-containing protein, partial [Bacteroidales bacterium]|nr:carboxypeptidase-like regulatory domain-containing protein [Bacteroidales bacterium]